MARKISSHSFTAWYAKHGRSTLPWRNTCDPYAIWLSEIMLQQTQVATVLERYYFPFLQRFPSIQALADAPLDDVLKAWEGLGYYTRARNLHKAAKRCAPALPETVDELMALPGIGRNTAHAIAAFAYRQPVAVMEANVKRILHRMAARERMSDAELWEMSGMLVNEDDPFTHNQAMMDVGALICTPRAPRCAECPLATACTGKDAPERYPARKAKKATPVRHHLLMIARDPEDRLYLKPREGAFLGGLYGFPEYDADDTPIIFLRRKIARDELIPLGGIEQVYSHFRLNAEVYLLQRNITSCGNHWYRLEEIGDMALSRADHKALGLYFSFLEEQALASPPPAARSPVGRKQENPSPRRALSRSSEGRSRRPANR